MVDSMARENAADFKITGKTLYEETLEHQKQAGTKRQLQTLAMVHSFCLLLPPTDNSLEFVFPQLDFEEIRSQSYRHHAGAEGLGGNLLQKSFKGSHHHNVIFILN